MLLSILETPAAECDFYSPAQAQVLSQALIREEKYCGDEYTHQFFLEETLALRPDSIAYSNNRYVIDRLLLPLQKYSDKRLSVYAITTLIGLVRGDFHKMLLLAYAVHRSKFGPKIMVPDIKKMFPYGLPNEMAFQRAWDDQVVHNPLGIDQNKLFYAATWK